jgi:hypothetical protein
LASKPLGWIGLNHWDDFLWFSLKTGGDGFFQFDLKISGGGFPNLGLKIGSYGLLIWAQNHRDGFLVYASKSSRLQFISRTTKLTEDVDGTRHVSRSSGLLHLEVS